jgi:hypothetical protein
MPGIKDNVYSITITYQYVITMGHSIIIIYKFSLTTIRFRFSMLYSNTLSYLQLVF